MKGEEGAGHHLATFKYKEKDYGCLKKWYWAGPIDRFGQWPCGRTAEMVPQEDVAWSRSHSLAAHAR
jgi:hypothetical protein